MNADYTINATEIMNDLTDIIINANAHADATVTGIENYLHSLDIDTLEELNSIYREFLKKLRTTEVSRATKTFAFGIGCAIDDEIASRYFL